MRRCGVSTSVTWRGPRAQRGNSQVCLASVETLGLSSSVEVDGIDGNGTGMAEICARVTPLVLRSCLALRFRPKKNFENDFLGFLI